MKIEISKQIDDSQIDDYRKLWWPIFYYQTTRRNSFENRQIVKDICLGDYRRPDGKIVNERQMRQSPTYLGSRGVLSADFPGEQLEPIRVNLLKVEIIHPIRTRSSNPGGRFWNRDPGGALYKILIN
jgi:hypothetical protein